MKKENKEKYYGEKINKIFEEFEEKEKEIEDLMPDGHMISIHKYTGEKFVNKEYHELMQKLLYKKLNLYFNMLKQIMKLFEKILKQK